MNILSLFDESGCGQVALERARLQGVKDNSIRNTYQQALCKHIVEICEQG